MTDQSVPMAAMFRLSFLLCTAAFLFYSVSRLENENSSHRDLRGLQDRSLAQEKEYYQGTALNFLIKYGVNYHLFDLFLSSKIVSKPMVTQDPAFHNGTSLHKTISDEFRTRSLKNAKYYGVATAQVQLELTLVNFTYTNKPASDEMALYNNKFRYGPGIDQRFMTIVFDRDPVLETTQNALAYIYFVGVNTELSESYNYLCNFTAFNVQSNLEITRRLRNVVNQETPNSLIRCAVPWSVSSAMNKDATEVVLELVRITATPVPADKLLRDIHVPRLHSLDRRTYKYSVQTMLEDLEDPMVVEWMVYNILLGVEHFYFYYNAKSPEMDLEHSILKPFLDANLLTIVYFPFLHTVHFNNVQHAALNAFLRQFSRYTEFVGFWDIDEFFLPTQTRQPHLNNLPYTAPVLDGVVMPLASDPNIPGIIFNTLDMDCDAESAKDAIHQGVTTHCQRTGFLFEEYLHSHGKMIVRPVRIPYVMSPHRLNLRFMQWTDDWQGGMFRHFNQFRYTRQAMSADKIGFDDGLRNFTLTSLRNLVGVYVKN